jgi:TetR/AcrR family transcriptional repressor of nem operon
LDKYTDWYIFVSQLRKMTKSEQTKAFIIEKTAPIFNSKGYAGTSLTDITDATNLTKGSIYGNFANKDEVALAAFDYNLRKMTDVFLREMAKYSSAKDKLLVYGRVYAESDNYPFPSGGCPILNTGSESDDTHPELRTKVAAAINGWKNKIISVLEEGIKNKEFSKNINTEQVAVTIIALIEGGILIARTTKKASYRTLIMQSLEQYIGQLK